MKTANRNLKIVSLSIVGLLTATRVTNAAVTAADIDTVKAKLNMAVPYFLQVWREILSAQGRQFDAPQVFTFSGTIDTGCGKTKPTDQLFYCPVDNRVYLDATALADLMKTTAAHTHTDGDYAAIVVAAHELGHAIDHQLTTAPTVTFTKEQTADCFAGAVTQAAQKDGHLDPGDLEEGRYALVISSDLSLYHSPVPDADGHGGPRDRTTAFNRGYYVGPAACLNNLGAATMPPGGRILHRENFVAPAGARPMTGTSCAWQPAIGGVLLTDIALQNNRSCTLTVMNFGTLPDNVRIEASFKLQSGSKTGGVGLFFGQPPEGVWASSDAAFVRWDGSYELEEVKTKTPLVTSFFEKLTGAKGYGAVNRVTVDIHQEHEDLGDTVILLLYINGRFAGIKEVNGWIRSGKANEQAGVFVELPGMGAVFSDFQVVALSE